MEQTFEITITGMENHTWQGRVRCGGEEAHFRSELELLLELGRRLPRLREVVDWAEAGGGPAEEGRSDGWRAT